MTTIPAKNKQPTDSWIFFSNEKQCFALIIGTRLRGCVWKVAATELHASFRAGPAWTRPVWSLDYLKEHLVCCFSLVRMIFPCRDFLPKFISIDSSTIGTYYFCHVCCHTCALKCFENKDVASISATSRVSRNSQLIQCRAQKNRFAPFPKDLSRPIFGCPRMPQNALHPSAYFYFDG